LRVSDSSVSAVKPRKDRLQGSAAVGANKSRSSKQEQLAVFVIDSDPAVCAAVGEVASAIALPCQTYASAQDFFTAYRARRPGCLVLEAKLPDMNGLQVQRRLARLGVPLPMIFLSDHADLSMTVELMRGGAVHYLQKPLRRLELLSALQEAIAIGRPRWKALNRRRRVTKGMSLLSDQEREVLRGVAQGRTNRQMASHQGVSLRTIEIRRANLMRKLKLDSETSLLHFALLAHRNGNGVH